MAAFGSKHHCAKLTESKVIELHLRYASGDSIKSMSKEYGVHPRVACLAIHGITWKRVRPSFRQLLVVAHRF